MKSEPVQNQFYKNRYQFLLRFLYIVIFVNLVLTVIFVYLFTHIPLPQTFSTYQTKVAAEEPFDLPIVSKQALLDWATQAAIATYNFDYVNYPKALANAESYFTPDGWQLFQNDFSKVVDEVVSKKLRVNAVAAGPPMILDEGPLLGRYSWKIRIPLLVTFESASEVRPQGLTVIMVVMRVPTTLTTKGIAIAQFYTVNRNISGTS